MPSILSVLLTASISPAGHTPASRISGTHSSSYALRTHAGTLLAHVFETYSTSYPSLRARLVSTLLQALLAGTQRFVDGSQEGEPPKTGAEAAAEAEARRASPTESVGTKLGAVIGLCRLGKGIVRTFLLGPDGVQDREAGKNALRLAGLWLDVYGEIAHGDTAALVAEVRSAAQGLTAPVLPAVASVEEEREKVEEAFGAFWASRLGEDTRARKGLLSALV